jgi:hypothetical protein
MLPPSSLIIYRCYWNIIQSEIHAHLLDNIGPWISTIFKGYALSTGEAKAMHWVLVKQRLYTEYRWSKGYTLSTCEAKAIHWVLLKQRPYTEYRWNKGYTLQVKQSICTEYWWSKGYTLSTGEAKAIHWVQVKQRLYTEYWWSKGYTLHTGLNLHIWWERPRVMDRVSPLGGWIVRLWYRKPDREP